MASILKGQSGQPIQFETKPNVNGDDVIIRPDIVGTVSQSGGVPTGAIIERGSNVNGEYVKYADGTMICTHKLNLPDVNISYGSLFISPMQIWTYPVVFAAANEVFGSINSSHAWVNSAQGTLTTNSSVFVWSYTTLTASPTAEINLVAIGRWY